MDAQTQAYIHYYSSQNGGQLPAFHGARQGQRGGGLGNFFGNLARTVFPIAAAGLGTFLSSMLQRRDEGETWKGSAKAALGPSAHVILDKALTAAKVGAAPPPPDIEQYGSGHRRRKRKRSPSGGVRKRRKRRTTRHRRSPSTVEQAGGGRKRRRRKRKASSAFGYKRGGKRARTHSANLKFLNF